MNQITYVHSPQLKMIKPLIPHIGHGLCESTLLRRKIFVHHPTIPVVNGDLIVQKVVDSAHLIGQQHMNDRIEYKQCDGRYHVPRLTGVSPDLELKIVTTQLIEVFLFVEAKLLFQVIAAMIVVEQEVMNA